MRDLGLDGRVHFDIPVGDRMTLTQAVAFQERPDARPSLAIVTAAAHDVNRWRLRILDADQRVTYEEVFGKTVRLLVARRASGESVLLLSGGTLGSLSLALEPTRAMPCGTVWHFFRITRPLLRPPAEDTFEESSSATA